MFAEIIATLLDLSTTKQGRVIFYHLWCTACGAVFIALVALPWTVGMEPQEFWRW